MTLSWQLVVDQITLWIKKKIGNAHIYLMDFNGNVLNFLIRTGFLFVQAALKFCQNFVGLMYLSGTIFNTKIWFPWNWYHAS